MKVYFTTSNSHADKIRPQIEAITKTIESSGHVLLRVDTTQTHDKEEGSVSVFKKVITSIRNCDFVIAELTNSSAGVGYEIALAIGEKKPVIIFYSASSAQPLSITFKGNSSKYLKTKGYKNIQDIEKTIKTFSKEVRRLIDTKFILIIPPEIDRYLEWNVKAKGIPKAEITRGAIEQMMKEDKKYQNFLQGFKVTE